MPLRAILALALAYAVLLAVVSLEVPLALGLRDRVRSETRTEVRGQAQTVAAAAGSPGVASGLDDVVATSAGTIGGRVLVVGPRGRVVADSAGPGTAGSSYASRPEVAAALRGRSVQEQRRSSTLGTDLLVTAVPVRRSGRVVGAVRVTQSVGELDRSVRRVLVELGLLGLLVLALGAGAGVVIARLVSRPLRSLEGAARRAAEGDLDVRVPTEGSAEQASLARSFNDMATRLGRLIEAQRRFVADASHQLRTPLTGLRLRIEEARDAPTREAASAELDAADAELDRMGLIVEELLVLGRAGERELPGERVPLDGVVRGAGERWRAAAAAAGAELRTSVVDAGVVWAAADDLDRALDALVENAVAYGAAGGEIVLAVEGTTLAVRDRGPGFAAGEEEAVRERFHRGAAGHAGPPGTGLGLAIAGELAALWEGTLEVGARPGGGAEVRLAFPPARRGR